MLAHCRKCGHDAEVGVITPSLACNSCGAIYAKVEAAAVAAAKADEVKRATSAAQVAEESRCAAAIEKSRRDQEQRNALTSSLCSMCGSLMRPRKVVKGSGATEAVLWITAILLTISIFASAIGVIGLIVAFAYSLWRFFGHRTKVCSACGSPEIYPANTPRGREELAKRGILT